MNDRLTAEKMDGLLEYVKQLHVDDAQKKEIGVLLKDIFDRMQKKNIRHIKNLNKIGVMLSLEQNKDRLLETILSQAMKFTGCDGGTLYLMGSDEKTLAFNIIINKSLNIKMGGTAKPITWPELNLYNKDGEKNNEMVAAVCALSKKTINIKDAYNAKNYNFEGTRKFDSSTGYRSKSIIVVPMIDHNGETVGVLQLLNKIDPKTKEIMSFSIEDQELISSLASQAAISVVNLHLINDLENLLEAFITSIATAIDEKSPYTGGHVRKVAKLTMSIVETINLDKTSKYKDVFYSEEELKQMRIAALMHDVGKITTPEYVMDKSTKLQTIFDRIELVKLRMEIFKKELKINFLEGGMTKEAYEKALSLANEDEAFIAHINIGSEFMSDDKIERLNEICTKTINIDSESTPVVTYDECQNLSIRKGTLTNDEREVINNHALVSYRMLKALPFPKNLRLVPEIAGAHHEKLNGKGYPQGLSAEEISLEGRILALADVFEALTACDRPYKEAKKLSEVRKILGFMCKDLDLDPDLVQFFYDKGIDKSYAKEELKPEQID